MKLFILTLLMASNLAMANSISGVVKVKGSAPAGVLYIFAKKFDGSMRMPLAVKKIESPKFPVKFTLDKSDQMMKGLPFEGPFKITARISPNGSVMDKSGVEVSTEKPVKLGDKNIELSLK
ncbi:MAG: hypothetical protein VYA54_08530 [Bdellovibrionota bacterium]|nr:hypothetical protein [Bdellovibrionota bacterium]